MTTTGRAAIFRGFGQPFEIRDYPVPEPGPGAAVVRITLANVCGSDLHTWRGDLDPAKRGRALPIHQGHEALEGRPRVEFGHILRSRLARRRTRWMTAQG